MNTPAIPAALHRFAPRMEEAPAFGTGAMPAEKERTFALLAHLFSLIIWLWKRHESPAVNAHGKEALNFGITVFLCVLPVGIVSAFLPGAVSLGVSVLLMVVQLGVLALLIYGGLKARDGKLLRYPLNFRLIK
jgi:uncharacterized protein